MEKTNEELRAELEALHYKVDIALRAISDRLVIAEKEEAQNAGNPKNMHLYSFAKGRRITLEFVQNILKP